MTNKATVLYITEFFANVNISAGAYKCISAVETLATTIITFIKKWNSKMADRNALAQMSPRTMKDIGITESDVLIEINKPFWK